MLLLFKTGWGHFLFGSLILIGGIGVLERLQGRVPGETFHFLSRTDLLTVDLALSVGGGTLGAFGIYAGVTLIGVLLAPKHFLRIWFSELCRVYHRLTLFRALCLGVMAGLMTEPLFRLAVLPMLSSEMGLWPAIFLLSGAIALASWTPSASLLTLAAFAESVWFSWMYLKVQNPFAPVIAHGIAELVLALAVWKIQALGATHLPPPAPKELVPVRALMSREG